MGNTWRISEEIAQKREHDFTDVGVYRGSGVVIQINRAHSLSLTENKDNHNRNAEKKYEQIENKLFKTC